MMCNSIKNEFNYQVNCICQEKNVVFKVIKTEETIVDTDFIHKKDLVIRGQFCGNCNNIIRLKSKNIVADEVFFNNIPKTFKIQVLDYEVKKLLNKFSNQNTIFYETFIVKLKSDYIKVITFLWKNGIIRIYRKKKNPKLTSPSELKSTINEDLKRTFIRNGYEIQKIQLTEKGRSLLKYKMKWDINHHKDEIKREIEDILSKRLKFFDKHISIIQDFRIEKILCILNARDLIEGRRIKFGNLSLDLINNKDEVLLILNILISIIDKIYNKKLVSLKELFLKKLNIHRWIRSLLRSIFNCDLILFNIFREPFKGESKTNVIFLELQNYILNIFEPDFKNFIVNLLKSYIEIDNIWEERIPSRVKKNVFNNFKNNAINLYGLSAFLAKENFNALIKENKISELISYTYFGAISKIICYEKNWTDLFNKFYPKIKNSNDFHRKFKSLNFIRIFVAHKTELKVDIILQLNQANLELSDILNKFYYYQYPLNSE
ncbi:MAG: hypothetical protein V3V33_16850 [Candidatus Lokiarchaeia archaeon]